MLLIVNYILTHSVFAVVRSEERKQSGGTQCIWELEEGVEAAQHGDEWVEWRYNSYLIQQRNLWR